MKTIGQIITEHLGLLLSGFAFVYCFVMQKVLTLYIFLYLKNIYFTCKKKKSSNVYLDIFFRMII